MDKIFDNNGNVIFEDKKINCLNHSSQSSIKKKNDLIKKLIEKNISLENANLTLLHFEGVNFQNISLKNANLSASNLEGATINGYVIPKNAKFGIVGEGFSGPFHIFNLYGEIDSFTVCTQIYNGKRIPWIFYDCFGNHKGGTIEEFNDKQYIILEYIEKLYKDYKSR